MVNSATKILVSMAFSSSISAALVAYGMKTQYVKQYQRGVEQGRLLQLAEQRPAILAARNELVNKNQQLNTCKSRYQDLKRMYYDRDGAVPQTCENQPKLRRGA